MSQKPRRTEIVVPTLLRLDTEARAMLDEYHAAVGGTLHAAAAAMISEAYALWQGELIATDRMPIRESSLAGKGYGPFGGAV